ncbi:hypothetical protein ACK8OR_14665 [Jannaschia sp. KMU-145]|uniref:COG3904 family protein n=1 Tax=Jannaschia halovivens TaxID=3388667 RepID=UPI00396AFC74
MTDEAAPAAKTHPERRTLRWLLGGQIAIAAVLVLIDLAPAVPGLMSPSDAPALDRPTRPGDQTRRYRPRNPAHPGPGVDPDMPRRLILSTVEGDRPAVLLRGAVEPGDGERIVRALEAEAAELVQLDSPGGSVSDALDIGRTIRALGLDTALAPGAVCFSACPYMFTGGVARTVSEDARLGVHQHSFGESTLLPAFLAVEDVQRGQAEVLAHLDAMGIDLGIMGPAMATPADEIYILTGEELVDWDVVTE